MKYKLLPLISLGLFGICQAFIEKDNNIVELRDEPSLEIEFFQLEKAAIGKPKAHSRGEDDFFDRDRERMMPIKPLTDEPESKRDGRKFIHKNCQRGKCQRSLSPTINDRDYIKKGSALDEKLKSIKNELEMLKKSIDRSKGKVTRRTPCNNKICMPRDDRPIRPFNVNEYHHSRQSRKDKIHRRPRGIESFVMMRNDEKDQIMKDSQISGIHFEFGMTKPSPIGRENIIPDRRPQCRKPNCTSPYHQHPPRGQIDDLESLISLHKLHSERRRGGAQYRERASSKYPEPNPPIENDNPHDSIDIPNLRPPYEKPRLSDPKHSRSWYTIVKKKVTVWIKTIKNTFNDMYKGFEKEPAGNKIAMILVIGLIAFLQICILVKSMAFLGKDYKRIPSHDDDDEGGKVNDGDKDDDDDEKIDLENRRKRTKLHSSK